MRTAFLGVVLLSCQLNMVGQEPAQTTERYEGKDNSFALVVASKVITTEGDWRQSDRLRSYANDHQGTYIVFTRAGDLLLDTDPSVISKAVTLYKEVAKLNEQQLQLGAKQAPLSKHQADLAAKMKEATSPEQMQLIGAEQGKVGREQGAVGREQGIVGQQQGVAGRAFYNSVQSSLRRCVEDRSCSKV
jgi:hypothetical protein